MAICDVCGNDYDKAFRITQAAVRFIVAPIAQSIPV